MHPPLPTRIPSGRPAAPLQIKEEVQVAQGISALIARLDVAGLLHYGNSARNSM